MKRNVLLMLCCIFIALPFARCTRPLPKPSPVPVTYPRAADVMNRLKLRSMSIHSLRGLLKVKVRGRNKHHRSDETLLLKKPGYLRVEALNFFGQPVFFFATNGRDLSFYLSEENCFYHGRASSKNLSRVIPIDLSIEELVVLLTGDMPLIASRASDLSFDEKQGLYVVTLIDPVNKGRQKLWIDPSMERVLKGEVFENSRRSLSVKFGDFMEEGGIFTPKRIELMLVDIEALLQFKSLDINPRLRDETFHLVAPEGASFCLLD